MDATHPNELVPIRAQVFDNDVKTLRPLNYHRDDNDTKVPVTLPMTTAAKTATTVATVTEAALSNSVGSTMKLSADAATFYPNSTSHIQQRLYNIQHQHQLQHLKYPQHQRQQQSSVESQLKYINNGIGSGNTEHLQQQLQQPTHQQQMSYGSANNTNSTYVPLQQHSSSAQPVYHQHHYHHIPILQRQHNAAVHMITNSVQDRLKIHHIESNNHHQQKYQQPQQQQQPQLNNGSYHHQFHNHVQQYQPYVNTNNQHSGYHGGNGGGFRPHNQGLHYQDQQQQQQQQQHQHHNRNQYQQHGSNSMAGQQQQPTSVVPLEAAAVAAETTNYMENIALDYLQTVIYCLNQNPGQFDSIASRFITIFDGMENNEFVLSIAMEDIFEESIAKPNFRYMGAKLYNLLHMLNTQPDSLFYTLLNCKLNFHQSEVQRFMENNEQNKVRETALFLAELYMQLCTEESRIQLIAQNIVYLLEQLLAIESFDNMRCICLTLKLAGYDLTADCPDDMNKIIKSLEMIDQKSPGKYPMAANVIALQKSNWGRKISGSESSNTEETPNNKVKNHEHETKNDEEPGQQGAPPSVRLSNDPVFYGPDGREITEEECEFLTSNVNEADDDDDENAPDSDIDFDLEMEEEHEHDYKEFIKQTKAVS